MSPPNRAARIWSPSSPTRIRFGDLRHMSLEAFVASAPSEAFWLFQHIPKTAGSSFARELSRAVAPYHDISVGDSQRLQDYDSGIRDALEQFLARPDLLSIRSASGHLLHPMTRKIWEYVPGMEMITFLRNPVARVVSDYRYQRSALHPGAETFRHRYPTLESFVADPASQNRLAHFIGDVNADRAELATRIERDYAFVGLVEMYPFSFNTAFALMGLPGRFPTEHARRTPDTADTAVAVDDGLRRRIRDLNRLDMAIYQQVHDILAPHVAHWRDTLKAAGR